MVLHMLLFIAIGLQAQCVFGTSDQQQIDMTSALVELELACARVMGGERSDLAEALLRKLDDAGASDSSSASSVLAISEAISRTCRLLSKQDALAQKSTSRLGTRMDFPPEHQLQESRRRLDEPWHVDSKSHALGFLSIGFVIVCIFVLLFERFFINSTLKFDKKFSASGSISDIGRACGFSIGKNRSPSVVGVVETSKPSTANLRPSGAGRFWNQVADIAKQDHGDVTDEDSCDVVGFSQPVFPANEYDGVATIALLRRGACKGIVEVRVLTREDRNKTFFTAKSGKDFLHFEDVIRFEDGETRKSFNVTLLASETMWGPTRSFLVELSNIVSGEARLQEPSAVDELQQDGPTMPGPTASIRILESTRFPAGMPEEDESKWYKVIYWYIKERIQDRKRKYWNTLLGTLYEPFHFILVKFVVQKALIDWATLPSHGGSYNKIMLLAGVYMFSMSIYRWGDTVRVKQHGCTGGCKMVHRQQVLTKMLMLEYAEHMDVPDYRWFYTAITDVDEVVTHAYYETFIFAKSIFALVLCVLTIVAGVILKYSQHGTNKSFAFYIPACGVILLLPLNTVCQHWRRHKNAKLLTARMASGEAWVETFGWLAHASSDLYAVSSQELADLQNMYTGQVKTYLANHTKARDYLVDTVWTSKWFAAIFYSLFMCVGGFRLLQDRLLDTNDFEIGDLVVLMDVYYKFGKYLSDLFRSLSQMQKGAVSIKRLVHLLNMKEHKSLEGCKTQAPPIPTEAKIELHDVQVTFPISTISPMGRFEMASGSIIALPLEKVVLIEGVPEPTLMSICALLGNVLHPTKGNILRPQYLSAKMLPPIPVSTPPRYLVQDAFQSICGSEQISAALAFALGLDASSAVENMGLGQKQLLALGRTMLVDPDILVLVRPLGCLSCEHKRRASHLLRMWQAGGAHLLLHTLSLHAGFGVMEETSFEDIVQRHKRTLIMTGESLSGNASRDVTIDLRASEFETGGFDQNDQHAAQRNSEKMTSKMSNASEESYGEI